MNSSNIISDDKDKEIELLKLRLQITEQELKECKEFFGYDDDMTLEDMKNYKSECEQEEKELRNDNEDYNEHCNKFDLLTDLVVQLGEYQYELSEIYKRMKKMFKNENEFVFMRKVFISSFNNMKNSVKEEFMEDFFDDVYKLIELQQSIYTTDNKISKLT